MENAASIFKALSEKTRLRIMSVLIEAGRALCICEIVDALALPQYNVSRHVKELRIAGLVREEKAGRFVFYSLVNPDSAFKKNIREALKSLDDGTFAEDYRRLRKRLALREDGKCVVGMRGCKQ